jgi:hypothetical protein
MKKFWIVLIALGLVAAFSMSASAADVKFSGSYYIEGWYDSNHSLLDKGDNTLPYITNRGDQALYHQRLRIGTEFKVAEGLTLTTRFDAMERNWGDRRERNASSTGSAGVSTAASVETASRNINSINSSTNASGAVPSTAGTGVTTVQEQANIEWERVFITANLPFGVLIAGYAEDIKWGTDFLDTVTTRPLIKLIIPMGNFTLVAATKKDLEGTMYNGYGAINTSDKDIYDLAGIFKWKSGEAGLLAEYLNNNAPKSNTATSASSRIYGFFPYFKQTFGPVYLEAEAYYGAGQYADFDTAAFTIQQTLQTAGVSVHAKVDLKPVYFGGRFIYMMGDDPTTVDKKEGSIAAGLVAGQAFLPCLMLFNDSFYTATGVGAAAGGYTGRATQTANGTLNTPSLQFMDNVLFFQGYGGVKPIDKLDIMVALAYARADQTPTRGYVSDVYGWEADLTATYKIYDNLSYMVGFGYLFTGDYFKGQTASANLTNDYMVMHKLTLTF